MTRKTTVLAACAAVLVGLVGAVSVADAGHHGGGFGGGGGFRGGGGGGHPFIGGGARSFSIQRGPGPGFSVRHAVPYANSFRGEHLQQWSRHEHNEDGDRHHHHRGFVGFYPYYGGYYSYGYGGGCGWLYAQAVATGNPYWWQRYYDCVGY
jgi:hypothetical protein